MSSPASEEVDSMETRDNESAKAKKERLREEQRQRRKAVSMGLLQLCKVSLALYARKLLLKHI